MPNKQIRHLKPPSLRDLFFTHSSLVHYIQSSSLYPGLNRNDIAYTTPKVDPGNDVRAKEMYWLGPARHADLIVLNRGPIAAPAWTYDGSTAGDWSFTDTLPYVPHIASFISNTMKLEDLRTLSILNAAMTVTLTKFLPEVLQTLYVLRSQSDIKSKPIVWHGSLYRFRRDQCEDASVRVDATMGIRVEEYFATILDGTSGENTAGPRQLHDPWGFYHDTQGMTFLSFEDDCITEHSIYARPYFAIVIATLGHHIFATRHQYRG